VKPGAQPRRRLPGGKASREPAAGLMPHSPAESAHLGQDAGVEAPARSAAGDAPRRNLVVRNALWRMVEGGGSELLSMAFFIILGRLLTPADFGVVGIAGVLLLSCQVILRSGFGTAIVQREGLDPAHLEGAFWANVVLAGALAALLFAIAVPLAHGLDEPLLMPVTAALAPTLVLSGAAWIFHSRFKREMRYDVVLWSTFASILGGGAAGVLLAAAGAGIWSLVGQQLTGALLGLLVLVGCSPWWPGLRFSGAHLKDLASFSAKIVASQGLETASQRAVPLILAFFVTSHMVGLYMIASRLTWALANVSMFVIFDLGLVVLSRLHDRPEHRREGAYQMLRLTALVCLPLFAGAALVADPLIPLLLGAGWVDSVPLFQLLCLFSVLFALYRCTQQILVSAGRPEAALRLAMLGGVLVPASTLAAGSFGLLAATLAAALAIAAVLPVAMCCLRIELGLRGRRLFVEQVPLWLAAGAMAMVVALVSLAGSAMTLHPLALVVLQVMSGSAVFFVVVLLLAPAFARDVAGALRDGLAGLAPGD
jgi:O-antigen/teichoic acid export membrane protein